ncbi:hypothetical protein Taro_022806 [Colocasia esculenta]|uniref:Uncharacterized protein n=1 Tax=Colocasia esculenta TaxID=4460 RepID=A0A843V2I7_COLES|nr:hypothetical protein [Colocasia esculenta]
MQLLHAEKITKSKWITRLPPNRSISSKKTRPTTPSPSSWDGDRCAISTDRGGIKVHPLSSASPRRPCFPIYCPVLHIRVAPET